MGVKLHDYGDNGKGQRLYGFNCPGCGYDHAFEVPRWNWNGSMDTPTFSPSLMCNKSIPTSQCHSFVKDGKIAFQPDCWHSLAGKTVQLPDYE